MPEHSSGPWRMTEILDHEGGPPVYRIEAESTLLLNVVPCADGYVPGANEANARLISAAPDLLAACEEIKRVALEEMGFRSYSVIEQAAIDGVIAAVEKAKH